jgi:hypothetical protein
MFPEGRRRSGSAEGVVARLSWIRKIVCECRRVARVAILLYAHSWRWDKRAGGVTWRDHAMTKGGSTAQAAESLIFLIDHLPMFGN